MPTIHACKITKLKFTYCRKMFNRWEWASGFMVTAELIPEKKIKLNKLFGLNFKCLHDVERFSYSKKQHGLKHMTIAAAVICDFKTKSGRYVQDFS